MPLYMIRNDITKMPCDAIVNPTDPSLCDSTGGVDGAIHKAAGVRLRRACKALGGCPVGGAKITEGYRLPCRYVIHTAGPIWQGGAHGELELLASCYRSALQLARQFRCATVAFPLISTGAYGFPHEIAMTIATTIIREFLEENDMTIYLVFYNTVAVRIGKKLFDEISEYIDDHYVDAHFEERKMSVRWEECRPLQEEFRPLQEEFRPLQEECRPLQEEYDAPEIPFALPSPVSYDPSPIAAAEFSMPQIELDESFSQMLLRKIDEKGWTDAQCYKKANIDRKLFSKIRSDVYYQPKKTTAIAFAVALELPLAETEELLRKAGYAISHSNKFDVIIEYFIKRGNYNVFEINEVLFSFDQCLLGA